MRIRLTLLASVLALVCPIASQADTFQYQFIGNPIISYNADFTFDSTSLITADTTVTPLSCTLTDSGSNGTCSSILVQPESWGSDFTLATSISSPWGLLAIQLDTGYNLDQLGTQTNGYDTLIVTQQSWAPATPEPSSLALLGTGILAFAGIARKRFA
jgi:hypothetical protein